MIEQLVEDLRGLQLAAKLPRDRPDDRLEDPGGPLVSDGLLIDVLLAEGGPVGVQIVEDAASLVLLGVESGQTQQAT